MNVPISPGCPPVRQKNCFLTADTNIFEFSTLTLKNLDLVQFFLSQYYLLVHHTNQWTLNFCNNTFKCLLQKKTLIFVEMWMETIFLFTLLWWRSCITQINACFANYLKQIQNTLMCCPIQYQICHEKMVQLSAPKWLNGVTFVLHPDSEHYPALTFPFSPDSYI